MWIVTTHPPRYGCATRGQRGTCSNKATIRLETMQTGLLENLTKSLESADMREELVTSLLNYLNTARGRATQQRERVARERGEMEATAAGQRLKRDNLVRAISQPGHPCALLAALDEVEDRLERLEALLKAFNQPAPPEVKEQDVRDFLNQRAGAFLDILLQEPELLKNSLEKHICVITLTPTYDDSGVLCGFGRCWALFRSGSSMQIVRFRSGSKHGVT